MLRGYRFSMVDREMKCDYEKLYGERGQLFSEIIEESVYEMAVLSKMILYLTGRMEEQNRESVQSVEVPEGFAAENAQAGMLPERGSGSSQEESEADVWISEEL